MARQNNSLQDMEESFAMISLEDEEQGGLMYEGETEDLGEIDTRWCLVGRFLTESPIDFQAMQHKMASLWRPGKGMYVKQLEPNRFIFQFYHEIDIKRVVDGSPWTFGRFHLIFERLKEGDNPRSLIINRLEVWVQLHGMNAGFMSQRVVKDIANYIGQFVESDASNFVGVWRDYLRVRVSLNLDVPLKRRMKLKKSDANWCWVNFMYEAIPTFCFICGIVGHGEKFCAKLFEEPLETIEKPYGAFMRAEPRRRSHTIGSKWLRSGVSGPGKSTVVDSGTGRGEVVTVINADSGLQGDNVGGYGIDRPLGVIQGRGEIQGISINSNLASGATTADQNGKLSKQAEDNNISESNDLIVLEVKRRRMGQDTEPMLENRTHDVEMTNQEESNQNQKNGLLAGTALQARLPL